MQVWIGSSRMTSTSTSEPERLPKREMSVRPLEMQLLTIERKAARPFGECLSWWIKRGRCQATMPRHDWDLTYVLSVP